jgi:hypothetical protein
LYPILSTGELCVPSGKQQFLWKYDSSEPLRGIYWYHGVDLIMYEADGVIVELNTTFAGRIGKLTGLNAGLYIDDVRQDDTGLFTVQAKFDGASNYVNTSFLNVTTEAGKRCK